MPAKRAHFDDEEPEPEYVEYWWHAGCGFCGRTGHDMKECPDRPLDSWIPSQKSRK